MKFLFILALFANAALAQTVTPVPKAHAHNDYEHDRPLLDALEQGFCSVEADVFAIDGELRVAHDRRDTKPGRTLEKLYLDPLQARVKTNAGSVHPNGPHFTLLIDFKTKAAPTYALLKATLNNYRDMLVAKSTGATPAVLIVISGNRPFDLLKADNDRLCGLDGRLSDLDSDMPAKLMPMISDNWRNHFKWRARERFLKRNERNCTTSSQKLTTRTGAYAFGPRPKTRHYGRNCLPPEPTISTPINWLDCASSCKTNRQTPIPSTQSKYSTKLPNYSADR